jgi:tetratricopeptide (TPR) repeat protein
MQKPTTDPPPAYAQAVALHRQGRVQEAEALYEAVLRTQSDHLGCIYQLGFIRLQQNRFADAAVLFRRAVKIDRKSADAQHHLAIALTGTAQFKEAVAHYRQALDLRPRDAAAHNNLGFALQKLARHEEAARHYREALSINPRYPEALNNLGNALQALDRTEEAIAQYRQALALRPNYAEAYSNLASALAVRKLHEEAIANCEKALALAPDNLEAHLNLANSLGATERPQQALIHYQKAIAIDPRNVEAHTRTGFMLFHLGRIEEAIAHCEQALSIKADHADALWNLGVALRAAGKLDEAIGSLERAIAVAPRTAATAYYTLASSKRMTTTDPHFAVMQQLAGEIDSLSVEDQIGLHFALGKSFADMGDHQRSFQHLLQGNALKRQEFAEHPFAALRANTHGIHRRIAGRQESAGDPSPVPVFIIGMPRSGTSLVEQILASHPKVFGAGERYEFGDLAKDIAGPGDTQFPEAVAGMSAEELRAFGASYLRTILPLAPAAERITDKMPSNFFYAGLINLALPNARIIHTRRDPRDTAMSCFSILFAMGHAHTYDLAELGRYMRAYERLMAHWRQVLPQGAMIEIQYEELVADLEGEARRIVEYCGLQWDSACRAFHKTKRSVRTASVIQVRQPIYQSSVGRWQPYEKELQLFLRALAEP